MNIPQTGSETGVGVLLVSDNGGTAIVLRALLESLGGRFQTARHTAEALPLLSPATNWIVMDHNTPPEDRLKLIAATRRQRLAIEFIVLDDTDNLEGVLQVMGYSAMAA